MFGSGTLGIIAGAGELPRRIIAECKASKRSCFVVAFEGITDASTTEGVLHTRLHIAKIGKAIRALREAGAGEIVMAGRVGRPHPSTLRPDFTGLKLLTLFRKLSTQGDDAVFSTIIRFLETKGFKVVGVDHVLADLVIREGAFGKHAPDKRAQNDIHIGMRAAREIGKLDIGQAVIVQGGVILGVEGAEGTDRLVSRCAELQNEGPGGVLVKMKKPGQDARVDLPSIGLYTVENAYAAGLRGIAVEAGGALVINRDLVRKKADELGLFIVGITPDAL